MQFIDRSFTSPEKNLQYDEELLNEAEATQSAGVLRLWESPVYFVVLGRTCKEEFDVDSRQCGKDNIPILRRSSGGGTVLQGPGCLNFSFIFPKNVDPNLQDINASYHWVLQHVLDVLQKVGVCGDFRPICDLVLIDGEKKFSGNAQRRKRTHILHHGTLLYNFDLNLITRYLKMPPKMPDYRKARPHTDFVANMTCDIVSLKTAFADLAALL